MQTEKKGGKGMKEKGSGLRCKRQATALHDKINPRAEIIHKRQWMKNEKGMGHKF